MVRTPGAHLTRRAACVAVALAVAALSASLASPASAADRYTPLVPSVMSKPRWFEDSRGRVHIAYELSLINGFPVPVTVTSV